MATYIMDYWKQNKKYWLPITDKDKAEADRAIYDTFHDYDPTGDNLFGNVVYYDQLLRHIDRHCQRTLGYPPVYSDMIYNIRVGLTHTVRKNLDTILATADEIEILFTLMPFKHTFQYDFIFETLHNRWLPGGKKIADYPHLSRFYYDTYRKAYCLDKVYSDIQAVHDIGQDQYTYRPDIICEYYPTKYTDTEWASKIHQVKAGFADNSISKALQDIPERAVVSLSGGVDSMVLLCMLQILGKKPLATHIIYGNRAVSQEEYQFVAHYCSKLGVPLYTYSIQWIKRGDVDRDFYEDITRQIRFMVYRAVGGDNPVVLLGHIKEDIVENIWTNLAKCQHLENLKKMGYHDTQLGVQIIRPMLDIDKRDIFALSVQLGIPFLNNTTPSWSNRGKFREHFYVATHQQFGEGVDNKLIQLADILTKQHQMLERLVYRPVYDSWNPAQKTICIRSAIEAELDVAGWLRIFEYVCHNHLGIGKPSIHSINEFIHRMDKAKEKRLTSWTMPMKQGLTIELSGQAVVRFIQ